MTTRGLGDGEDDEAEEDRIARFGARLGLGRARWVMASGGMLVRLVEV